MTLLKRFTGWAIGSNRTPKQQIHSLRSRLLVSYLTVMAGVLATSSAAMYVFFTRSHDHQLNSQLLTLAQAAVPSLEAVEKSGLNSLNQDLPWLELFKRNQSLEWFNEDGKLLARKGTIFSTLPLKTSSQIIQQQGQVRTLTIAVYADISSQNGKTLRLEGYIRANESTEKMELVVNRLILGLGLGKTMALICSGIGGLWLTQQVLVPLEQTFQRLKQFTADASHELRNPLTAINTAVEVMQSHPERIHPLDTNKLVAIASASDQLTSLAEDLLFLARTDATMAPVELEGISVPLDEVLQDLVELFYSQTQAKGITFTSQLLAGISVKGEVAELKRLFFNLLDNACKYTPTGGSVSLSMAKHKRFVVVEVKDTGIGIAPEYESFIFQRFWRSNRVRSQQIKGSGLGLAIAQVIVHKYRGKITVSSQIGVGSCFQVHLPMV